MKRRLVLALAISLAVSSAAAIAAEPASQPMEICPLLVGAKVPELTLTTGEGKDFDLGAAAAADPLILIFYRGGW